MNDESVEVLLIEDNAAHAMLILRSFKDFGLANGIHWVKDGEAALDYLFQRGDDEAVRECKSLSLVILDLRLPKLDGHEVLQKIKNSDKFKMIPVVVLTTSLNREDIRKAYANNVNSYLVKPMDFDALQQMIEEMGYYWLQWNKSPEKQDNALYA
jgi:CheY-like chemotaxis protein